MALMGLALVWLGRQLSTLGEGSVHGLAVGGVSLSSRGSVSSVEVEQDEEGVYHVRLRGEFELHVNGEVEFYKRLLVIFLGHLEVAGESRGSRRTRDGRTPFVQQERLVLWGLTTGQLADWFGVPQPNISRWFSYWLERDWRRMLSQKWGEVLTLEVQQRVIESWVKFPWWSAKRMWQHLQAQGSAITLRQVRQTGRESGWSVLRKDLSCIYAISVESFRHLS